MTQKNRKESGGNFNLQPAQSLSLNGTGASHLDAPMPGSGETTKIDGQTGQLGKIEVSPKAIAHLASRAAQASYGVVGMASRNARPGWADILHRDEGYKGVEVKFSGERVVVDLYVIIEYGTRISEVARNIMASVKFSVESALGVPVVQVNVTVQGIRVSA